MEFKTILLDVKNNVARITLNRPEVKNAVNVELARDMMYAALQCSEDSNVRAVLLSGNGDTFCAGGDVKSFATQGDNLPAFLKEAAAYVNAAMLQFAKMDAPLVTAVHGAAAGFGMSVACAGDITLASESCRFAMAYATVGLTPDGSASYSIPRLIGLKRALDLALTGRVLSAREAYEWGMVTRVVPDSELMNEAEKVAIKLASGPTMAFGAAKKLLHEGWTRSMADQVEFERHTIADMGRTEDARVAIAAFVEKQKPEFHGR